MPEIKTTVTKQELDQYMKDNQLDVLNHVQIAAKLMELETKLG